MKKLLLVMVAGIATQVAMAQTLVPREKGYEVANPNLSRPASNKSLNKVVVSDWYDPIDMLNSYTQGNGIETFVSFSLPDSLPKYINSGDTAFRPQSIAFGQVIDPKDEIINQTDNPGILMSQYVSYKLDSIYLQYIYVRNVDSIDDGLGGKLPIVDTLFINYFQSSGLTKGGPLGTPPFVYALPGWSISNLNVVNPVATQVILLTRDDSTTVLNNNGGFENSWRLKTLIRATPENINVAAGVNNFVGYTFRFKPGMAYNSNSVYVYQRDPATFTGERVNYFGYRFAANTLPAQQQWRTNKYYSHSLFSNVRNAYYPSNTTINNGWTGFIPGSAYFEGQTLFSGLHLTTDNKVGLNDIKNNAFAVSNVYPNPAYSSDKTVFAFNLKESANVNVTITNLVGQQVKVAINKNFTAGEHAEFLDITGMKAGVYFVTMTVNGNSISKKLTIVE
jgi:hypothetical protein